VNLLYTPMIGFPACTALIGLGLLLCLTVVGIPPGLALIALGFKVLTLRR
jgi:hypothetical protein